MTQSKPRAIKPNTMDLAIAARGGFTDPLKEKLGLYFNAAVCEEMAKRVLNAIASYEIEMKANPDRKIIREQRSDRHELIETMKELNIRLLPWHIPLPVYTPARTKYTPLGRGKSALRDEIGDLVLRIAHLQALFESINIPTPPGKTNPGKPERARLVLSLKDIVAEFRSDLKQPKIPLRDNQANFIGDVVALFGIDQKRKK
ncbi:MAG: hypothetical protein EPN72_14925 [Nevskiaceae bacterium]|nr:MAG: hypothetical protein EPN72_14925 [Nevskiaceae bacterium]TBR76196.1 MAG: hypothetical protein EPN64_08855 [Burkholderiaceae bacterium]